MNMKGKEKKPCGSSGNPQKEREHTRKHSFSPPPSPICKYFHGCQCLVRGESLYRARLVTYAYPY